jgi:hypothetical protein
MFVGNEREQAGLHRLDWQSFALPYDLVELAGSIDMLPLAEATP